MDGEVTIQPPPTLRGFCQTVYEKHSRNWPPSESIIAEEFLSFSQLQTFATLERLQHLCQGLGVKVSVQELPKGIRGFNHAYENNREIVIGITKPQAETLGSREHTLLHELREQIEYEFRKTGHPVINADLERRAEGFAIAVRMSASQNGIMAFFESTFSEVKSIWGVLGLGLLFVIASLGAALVCNALPRWEEQI